jgi:Na+-translocating ferredoxin:NAD+ oxidoreductase subunit B
MLNSADRIVNTLAQSLNAVLPQTQCQRCGFAGCAPYAQAMAESRAAPNRCPPGGAPGVAALSKILGITATALDPSCGAISPRTVATIQEALCIGCTKCIDVCPTDAIVGAPKSLHFVIAEFCTGCDLCLPPCPVDCITMNKIAPEQDAYSWQQWSTSDARTAKRRFEQKQKRFDYIANEFQQEAPDAAVNSSITKPPKAEISAESAPKQTTIASTIERARAAAKQRLNRQAKDSL